MEINFLIETLGTMLVTQILINLHYRTILQKLFRTDSHLKLSIIWEGIVKGIKLRYRQGGSAKRRKKK